MEGKLLSKSDSLTTVNNLVSVEASPHIETSPYSAAQIQSAPQWILRPVWSSRPEEEPAMHRWTARWLLATFLLLGLGAACSSDNNNADASVGGDGGVRDGGARDGGGADGGAPDAH